MAAPSFYSNWPTTFHHNAAVPPPTDLLPFHDNFALPDPSINNSLLFNSNHYSSSFNNNSLQFHSPINYPSLSSSYNPITAQQQHLPSPLHDLTQQFSFAHEYYSDPLVPDACDVGGFFPMDLVDPMQLCNQPECYSYPSHPIVPDACFMEQVQPELQPLPEIYNCDATLPSYYGGPVFDVIQGEDRNLQIKEIGDACGPRLSTQSMAARVRRRKISEKTSELGKLVPGGHRMTTAEMFQAAFKYIKFLQAQVAVLEFMPSSPGLGLELQGLLTSTTVQEKLYAAGKCVVSQTLAETLVDDHISQGTKD